MQKVIHKADTRGKSEHGWLHSKHTFSFAYYFNADRMGFGNLRVINDDIVDPSMGFSPHSHDNMEIISIPVRGTIIHKDNRGNEHLIKAGEVQVMSAGTGITHTEFNALDDESVNFLQIWIFPKEKNIEPRYGSKEFSLKDRINHFQLIISPDGQNDSLIINQDAFIHLGYVRHGFNVTYNLHDKENGVYIFLIDGRMEIANEKISRRDGIGIFDTDSIEITAIDDCDILLMEVPIK